MMQKNNERAYRIGIHGEKKKVLRLDYKTNNEGGLLCFFADGDSDQPQDKCPGPLSLDLYPSEIRRFGIECTD
jgi:hypothetical protein